MKDLISVVIPNLNYGSLIGETIDSIVTQNYSNIEIIVIDDDPTDLTYNEVVKKIKLYNHFQIRYYHNECPPRGGHYALNVGIKMMRGEYFSYISADELCLPDKYLKLIASIKNDKLDMVFSGYFSLNEGDELTDYHSYEYLNNSLLQELLFDNYINSNTALIRKDALEKTNLFIDSTPEAYDYWMGGEYYKWLELATIGKIGYINEALNKRREYSSLYNSQISLNSIMHAYYIRKYLNNFQIDRMLNEHSFDYKIKVLLAVLCKHGMTGDIIGFLKRFDLVNNETISLIKNIIDSKDLFQLGLFNYYKKNFNRAIECFTASFEKFETEQSFYHLGISFYNLNKYEEAEKIFQNITKRANKFMNNVRRFYHNSFYYLGEIYLKNNNKEKSVEMFKQCLSIHHLHIKAADILQKLF